MRFSTKRNKVFARLWLTVVVMTFAATVTAQAENAADSITAREIFRKIQSPAIELLKESTRLDMLDYWDADSVYHATNALGGKSYILGLSSDYIKVCVSPVSHFEIKLLPLKKDRIVMTIYTVGDSTQAPDSHIQFFDRELREVNPEKYFKEPDLKYFFDIPRGSLTSMKEIREMIPFPTIEYSASPDSDTLHARLTVGEYMNMDDYNIIRLFLKPEIRFEWKEKYKIAK